MFSYFFIFWFDCWMPCSTNSFCLESCAVENRFKFQGLNTFRLEIHFLFIFFLLFFFFLFHFIWNLSYTLFTLLSLNTHNVLMIYKWKLLLVLEIVVCCCTFLMEIPFHNNKKKKTKKKRYNGNTQMMNRSVEKNIVRKLTLYERQTHTHTIQIKLK